MKGKSIRLKRLADLVSGDVQGNGELEVFGVASLDTARPNQLGFVADKKKIKQFRATKAGALVIPKTAELEAYSGSLILTDNPYWAYAKIAQFFDNTPVQRLEIHPTAVIDPTAELSPGVAVGPNAVIGSGVKLGVGVKIGPGCVIGENCTIHANTTLHAHVTLYHHVTLGEGCVVHAASVLGSDGFGYAQHDDGWEKIPQVGGVVIGNSVEIGAGCTIDRGALTNTVIEDGVILDNQVHIAHNVRIGAYTAIAGCSAIAGSTTVGKWCQIGGHSAVSGHIQLADNVMITGCGMVPSSLLEPGVYSSGLPAMPNRLWRKTVARLKSLEKIFSSVRRLENSNLFFADKQDNYRDR